MVRRMLFAGAMFALVIGSASEALAQVKVPLRWDGKVSWGGSIASSAHQDAGIFGFYKPVRAMGNGYFSIGGEVRIGYEYGYSGVQYYLGTFRYMNDSRFKWPGYIDIYGGIEHFDGGTIGYVEPAAGLVLPWGFGDFKLIGQIGMPVHFYSGNAEVGFSGQVGFTFPFMQK